jgi:hypothetical protein
MTAGPVGALVVSAMHTRGWLRYVGEVLCILLVWAPHWAAATTPGQPLVEGVGVIVQNNQAAARTRAIQEALRKAIEQVVIELLEPRRLVEQRQTLETQVYARAARFVRSYRVLWEYPDVAQKVYRVGVEAEVASTEITQAIGVLGGAAGGGPAVASSGAEPGGILLRLIENQLEQTGLGVFGRVGGIVAAGIRTQLQAQGFRMVNSELTTPWDGQESSALTAARGVGATVVLVGQADVERIRSDVAGIALQAVEASVQIQAFAAQSGERLALEHVQTTTLHTDATMASKQALEKAAGALATRLTPSLRAYQQQLRDLPSPGAVRTGQ